MSAEKDKGMWYAVTHALPFFTWVVLDRVFRRWLHVFVQGTCYRWTSVYVFVQEFELDFLIFRSQLDHGGVPIVFEIFQWSWLCKNTKHQNNGLRIYPPILRLRLHLCHTWSYLSSSFPFLSFPFISFPFFSVHFLSFPPFLSLSLFVGNGKWVQA